MVNAVRAISNDLAQVVPAVFDGGEEVSPAGHQVLPELNWEEVGWETEDPEDPKDSGDEMEVDDVEEED